MREVVVLVTDTPRPTQVDKVSSPTSIGGQLSRTIWNIQWEQFFPYRFENSDVSVELSSFEENADFAKAHYAEIYEQEPAQSPFLTSDSSEAKARYFKETGDFFSFKSEGRTVGIFVGTPIDWSTYYLRNASLLPAFQGKKLYQNFLIHFLKCLTSFGVDRAEGDVAPSNLGHVHVLTKLEFNITGYLNTERWGALVHFTKFLNVRNETVFLNQYCWGVRPQQKQHQSSCTFQEGRIIT